MGTWNPGPGPTSGADVFEGDDTREIVNGGAGHDILRGNGGDDELTGGPGNDTLEGGAGNDMLEDSLTAADNDDDVMRGGAGDDYIYSLSGADIIDGGLGTDTASITRIAGNLAIDIRNPALALAIGGGATMTNIERVVISMGTGTLTFFGGALDDVVNGGDGNDTLDGGGGSDDMRGGAGNDTMRGGDGIDFLYGGAGNDFIVGGAGRDALRGDAGDDIFEFGQGELVAQEYMEGGTGNDTLRQIGDVDYRTIIFQEFERLQFQQSAGEATLRAQFTHNQAQTTDFTLSGSPAQDSVQVFVSLNQSVNLQNWRFDYPSWGFTDYIVYVGDMGNESFVGFPGLDIFFSSPGADTFDGRGGADFAAYLFSIDAVVADLAISGPQFLGGGSGFDTFINLEGLAGSQFSDTLRGDNGDNFLLGVYGDDTLIGRAGNDDIRGGEGADRIEGGMGADILWGTADIMSGADGADIFVYRTAAEGGDTIMDFHPGFDKVEVSAAGFGLVAGGAFAFVSGAAPAATTTARTFLYNTATGALSFDADGAGAAAPTLLAILLNHPTFLASDILVTAIPAADIKSEIAPEVLPATLGPDVLAL